MIYLPSRRVIRPYEKPPFEITQRHGLDWQNAKVSLEGCVGYWLMNEGAGNKVYDLSGNGNDGTEQQDAVWQSGIHGTCRYFNGDDYIQAGNIDFFNDQISAFALINANTFDPATNSNIVLSKYETGGNQRVWVLRAGTYSGTRITQTIAMYIGDPADGTLEVDCKATDNILSIGSWHFVGFTFDKGTLLLWVDGISYSPTILSGAVPSAIYDTSEPIRIGAFNLAGSPANHFKGKISSSIIYNRALSASETALLHREPFCQLWIPKTQIIAGWVSGGGANNYVRTINDGLGVSDIAGRTQEQVRIMSDAVGIADAITRTQALARTIADGIGYDDGVTKIVTYARTIAESLGITEAITRASGFTKAVSDGMGITDSVTATAAYARLVANAMGVTDDVTRTQIQLRAIADSLGLTDVMAPGQMVILADGVGIADEMIRTQIQVREFADALGITDDLTRIADYIFLETEDVGISDAMLRVAVALRTVSDAVGSTDTRSVSHVVAGAVKAAWAFMIIRQTN